MWLALAKPGVPIFTILPHTVFSPEHAGHHIARWKHPRSKFCWKWVKAGMVHGTSAFQALCMSLCGMLGTKSGRHSWSEDKCQVQTWLQAIQKVYPKHWQTRFTGLQFVDDTALLATTRAVAEKALQRHIKVTAHFGLSGATGKHGNVGMEMGKQTGRGRDSKTEAKILAHTLK